MSDIAFQNGFICGMATRGLTRSGQFYEPIIWNDEGEYSYFYIDFKMPIEDFSTGMFSESVIVHDSSQLPVTDVDRVSATCYRITCNIAGKTKGVTVMNKKTSWLYFSSGSRVPEFSTWFQVSGLAPNISLKYVYDQTGFERDLSAAITELFYSEFKGGISLEPLYESLSFVQSHSGRTINENVSITLI